MVILVQIMTKKINMNKPLISLPLISIITPVYNSDQFISHTINSVLNQTYENWELLLVDDCSSDKSLEILLSYAHLDSRIKVFKNKINSKAFESRNVALRNAKGSFIAFLDSDDLWIKDKLELQVKFMLNNNYVFTYTAFSRFKGFPNNNEKIIRIVDKVSYRYLLGNSVIVTSSVMINKNELGYFEMKNVYYDDFVLWLELLSKTQYAYCLDICLLNYRISLNSLSNNKLKSAKKMYYIFNNSLCLNIIESHFYFCKWVFNTSLRYILKY